MSTLGDVFGGARLQEVINRRRFMGRAAGLATLMGLAPAIAYADPPTMQAACDDLKDWHCSDECRRTLKFLCRVKLERLFKDPLPEVLEQDVMPNVSTEDWNLFSPAFDALKDTPRTLEFLYTNHPSVWGGTLKAAFDSVASNFKFPFVVRAFSNEEREAIALFLNSTAESPDGRSTTYDGFLQRFGDMSLVQAYSIKYNEIDAWGLHLIRLAKELGLFRISSRGPRVLPRDVQAEAFRKEQCAVFTGTAWKCIDSEYDDDACGIDTQTGQLLSGTDLCGS